MDPLQMAVQQIAGSPSEGADAFSQFTNIYGQLSPEEQQDFTITVPAMQLTQQEAAQGKDARTQLYETLRNSNDQLSQKRSQLIQQMATDAPLSKSQTAAMLFIGLLPSLVGGAIKGKKGIAAGAQAGALGATTMARGLESEKQRERQLAGVQLESVDRQLERNSDLSAKAQLDEINAADTATQKGLDREATLGAAAIRAGGERSAAELNSRALTDQTKELRNNRLTTEQAARAKPIRYNGVDYVTSGSVTDKDVEKVRDGISSFKTFNKLTTSMINEVRGKDFAFFENQMGDSASKLSIMREAALSELAKMEEIPGRGGEYQIERLKKMLSDPTALGNNIFSRTPVKATIEQQLKNVNEVMSTKLDILLQDKGMDRKIPIGKRYPAPNGKLGWYIGMDAQGIPIVTIDEQKYLDILEGVE